MDADLQKSIREFDPSNIDNGLWVKLARLYPLYQVLNTCPLDQLSLSQLFKLTAKLLGRIGSELQSKDKQIRKSNDVIKKPTVEEFTISISNNTDSAQLIKNLSYFLENTGLSIDDENDWIPEILINFYCNYDDHDREFRDLDLTFSILNWRPETAEEKAARLLKVAEQKKKSREVYKKRVKQLTLKKEQEELEVYQRLKKKFEKK